jgi:hypothetical protein
MVSSPTAYARHIWVALETTFHNNGLARAMNLTREFHDTKQLETPLSTYCASLKAISNALRDVGHLLSTPALLLQLVRGLHRRHETTGKLIQDQASTLTFAVAVDKLTMDEQQSKPSSSSSTSALVSFTKQPAPPATPPYTKFFYQYRQCMLQFFYW